MSRIRLHVLLSNSISVRFTDSKYETTLRFLMEKFLSFVKNNYFVIRKIADRKC